MASAMYGHEMDYDDPGRLRSEEDREEWQPTCDRCGKPEVLVTLQGVGMFCSRTCATAASEDHAAVLLARMFAR